MERKGLGRSSHPDLRAVMALSARSGHSQFGRSKAVNAEVDLFGDPQAWLADILARIADHSAIRLDELLPWNWVPSHQVAKAA